MSEGVSEAHRIVLGEPREQNGDGKYTFYNYHNLP